MVRSKTIEALHVCKERIMLKSEICFKAKTSYTCAGKFAKNPINSNSGVIMFLQASRITP